MSEPLLIAAPLFDADSLCAEIDPEIWFPEVGGSVAAAKKLCRRCENQDACLEWALEHDEFDYGVWGGTSPNERKRMARERSRRRELKPIKHGTEGGYKAHHRRGETVPDHDPCGCRAAARLASAEREQRGRAA